MAKTFLDTKLYILWVPFKTLGQVECPVFGACIVFYIPMCFVYMYKGTLHTCNCLVYILQVHGYPCTIYLYITVTVL